MEKLYEHIDELIADKISGEISEADDLRLAQLISTDDEVRAKFEASLVIVELYRAKEKSKSINDRLAWTKLEQQLTQENEVPVVNISAGRRKWWVAASILIPLVTLGLWFGLKNDFTGSGNYVAKSEAVKVILADGTTYELDKEGITTGKIHFDAQSASKVAKGDGKVLPNEIITLAIPSGKTYDLVLDDGTAVKINSASTIKFPLAFNGDKREVELDGEAYFEVTKGKKPFIVKTNEMDVRVLGTSFNINTYPGYLAQTSLVEGSVFISSDKREKSILIKPGQAAVKRNGQSITVENFAADHVLSWLKGTYYFNNMPLREIVNITNRVTGEEIYITDSKIANYRFSGALKIDKPIKVLLENIKSSSADVQYSIKNGRVELY